MNDATKIIDGKLIRRTRILCSKMVVFSAWEPSSYSGPHSSLCSTEDGQVWGEISSRRLTPELDALPAMSDERSEAVYAYHEENRAECYDLILQAFADASDGEQARGEITLYL